MDHLERLQTVLREYQLALATLDNSAVILLGQKIIQAKRVYLLSAGRTRCVMQMFAMRLAQASIPTQIVGEVTTTAITPDDLLLVASGSGETSCILTLTRQAKLIQTPVFAITATASSTLQTLSEYTLLLPSSADNTQLLGSFNENCLLLVLDQVMEEILHALNKPASELQQNHANIE